MARKDILNKSRKKRAQKTRRRFLILFLIAFILIASGTIYFLRIEKFGIQGISIQGNIMLNGEEITSVFLESLEGEYLKVIPKNNIFVFPKGEITEKLKEEFPRIRSIDIDRKLPNILSVEILERESIALFCRKEEDEKCSFIDENGLVFEEAPFFSGDIFVKFFDESEELGSLASTWKQGFQVVPEQWFKGFMDFVLILEEEEIMVEKVVFEKEELYKVYMTEGWYILLNKNDNLGRVFDNLKLTLEKEIGGRRENMEYIDLRLENKVFYKFK